jgi:hypothetical protein
MHPISVFNQTIRERKTTYTFNLKEFASFSSFLSKQLEIGPTQTRQKRQKYAGNKSWGKARVVPDGHMHQTWAVVSRVSRPGSGFFRNKKSPV